MEGRRARRFGRVRRHSRSFLPLHVRSLSNTVSCWYCDFKTSIFNEPLFRVGRNYARCLRVWFSVGIGFSLTTMLGAFLILLRELVSLLHLCDENAWLGSIFSGSFSRIPSPVNGFGISVTDVGYICMSTIIAVSAHEFGHAFAAASEGIPVEYVAVFLAVLFPGALVAFNYELLQTLSTVATLRIYCAGIWHNAVCCAYCGLALFMLPLILYPFYIHGESPMVLEIPPQSPLSGFLSPGDLITSLDGTRIHNTREWMDMAAHVHDRALWKSNPSSEGSLSANLGKGYCLPSSMMEASKNPQLTDGRYACPNDFSAFVTISCLNSSLLYNASIGDNHLKGEESVFCLMPSDVVKLKKCDDGWEKSASNKSSCPCSEDESCLAPVQTLDSTWTEIAYSSPYTPGCWQIEENRSAGFKHPDFEGMGCGGAFVFIGDVVSMAHSIRLTSFRPRWPIYFGAFVPNVVEKILMWTFHVSLVLALLNSLPVYFLDGESILEAALSHSKLLSPRVQRRALKLCLFGGTLVSLFALLRILFLAFSNT